MECSTRSPVKEEEGNNAGSTSVSRFLKTVVLEEWWLIKVDDDVDVDVSRTTKSLGVAGITSKNRVRRAFSSAAIRRTYDVSTLETVDKIIVFLEGFINKPETEKNGFSAEVFKHFVFGFPPYWEKCVGKFLEGEPGEEDVSRSTTSPEKSVIDAGGSDQKDLSEATKQSTKTSRKRKSRSSVGVPDANQCLDEICAGTPNSNKKTITKSRLKACDNLDSNQAGNGITVTKSLHISKNQNINSISRVQNCDKNDSSQAGKDDKSAKKVLQNCTSSSSKKKTKRKLTYGKSDATLGETNGASSASPQLSSLKKSRSGRKLVPTLEFWCNQTPVYDKDRELTSIKCRSSDGPRR